MWVWLPPKKMSLERELERMNKNKGAVPKFIAALFTTVKTWEAT